MSRDYVFSIEELSDPEVAVVKALQAFREEHGILGCHRILNSGGRSLKDRLGDMAGNNMLALAEKRAKREAAKRAADDAERAVATGAGSSALTSSKAVTQVPGERPLKKVRTEALKGPLNSGKGVDSSASHSTLQTPSGVSSSQRISWATPDPEEDAAMKLLGQQGQRVFTGSSAVEMKDFLDEVAALPQIKRDFEAVSKKLKDDEVVMQDALKKVKGLSDDNIRLTDKNKELEEEIKKLKSDLDTKRSEAIQAVLEKQKMAEDLEGAREEWKVKATEFEKEIQRVEDLWDESAEGPSESEMVDAQILGLEDNKSDGDATVLPDVQG
ncbi:putative carboxy-terminal kinesin 2-like isoform X1 [Sesbania bispinosa]|nr:putative carboxy-terminal kinesin 2-like isoform X1 [Sesbania bispinosa]